MNLPSARRRGVAEKRGTCKLAILWSLLMGSVAASPAGAQEIIGAWSRGDTTRGGSSVIVFLADGHYVDIEHAEARDGAAGFSGLEYGNYTWDRSTGVLTVKVLQDRNGELGLSPLDSLDGVTLGISRDTATLVTPGFGTRVLDRVTGSDPVVGAWGGSYGDEYSVLVFLANGVYFQGFNFGRDYYAGRDGIEHGTYSRDPAFARDSSLSWMTTTALYHGKGNDTLSYWAPLAFVPLDQGRQLDIEAVNFPYGTLPRIGAVALNYQGMWGAPDFAEMGWGINFTHQGDLIFASWFTYDASGDPLWVTATLAKAGYRTYAGSLDATTGPPYNATSYDPSRVTHRTVGSAAVAFADDAHGTFSYTLNGVSQTKALGRFEFATPVPACVYASSVTSQPRLNSQDMWVVPDLAESGWGINFTHQGRFIFASWFIYGETGNPLWVTATLTETLSGTYAGAIDATTGPPFDSTPFDPSRVVHHTVGAADVRFADPSHATLSYTLDGVAVTKPLTRFVFDRRSTVCQ